MTPHVILVVEDDPSLRLLTGMQLKQLGYVAKTVETGEAAVELTSDGISLILMDIGLPGIDGISATMQIREQELKAHRNRIPIVALTAHSDRERCLYAGMDDFLQKPVLLDTLAASLKRLLPD